MNESEFNTHLVWVLKAFRLYYRMSQAKLAREMGVPKSYISDVECKRKPVTLKHIKRCATRFGVQPSEIVWGAEVCARGEYFETPTPGMQPILDWLSNPHVSDDISLHIK